VKWNVGTVEIALSQSPQHDRSVPIQTVIGVNGLDVLPNEKTLSLRHAH
jgi:hypothetical protein